MKDKKDKVEDYKLKENLELLSFQWRWAAPYLVVGVMLVVLLASFLMN